MTEEKMIDYAYPLMMAENALKGCHKAALVREYDIAMELVTLAIADAKLTITALKHMKEHEDALRKQAPTLQERVPTAESAG